MAAFAAEEMLGPAPTLSLEEVQQQVQAHFSSSSKPGGYEKEMSETLAVFRKLSMYSAAATATGRSKSPPVSSSESDTQGQEPIRVLSLACGSAVGAEVFNKYLTHPNSKFYGMDISHTQTVQFLQKNGYVHGFILEDLYAEPASQEAVDMFESCTHWMAIHACRELAARVVYLFKKYAPLGAHLIAIPCCLFKSNELQTRLGHTRWKAIRAARQARDTLTGRPTLSNWRQTTQIQARNELLAKEFAEGFCDADAISEIQSLHNVALHYVKKPAAGGCDGDSATAAAERINLAFDALCTECAPAPVLAGPSVQ